jgi:hypothetical protein
VLFWKFSGEEIAFNSASVPPDGKCPDDKCLRERI